MLNTSILQPFWRELEMSPSTEDQELFSRVSKSQIGPLLKRDTDGKSMLTQDKLGITPCTISTLNGPQCNSGERDKSQTLSNGSDSSNSVRDLLQDSSTTRCHIQLGSDIMAISITQKRFFTPSLMEIKTNKLSSELIPLLRREESNGKLSMLCFTKWLHRSLRWRTSNILIKWVSGSLTSHTTEEFGNTIEITLSELRLLMPSKLERLLRPIKLPLLSSSEEAETSTFPLTLWLNKVPDLI